jgi:hypothetical protein
MLNESAGDWGRRLLAAALIALLVLCIYWVCRRLILGPDRFTIEQTSGVVSTVDGVSYRVHGGHAGAQQAADTLATLNLRVIELIRHLRGRYAGGAAGARYPARRRAVQRLLARYNPDNLAENSPKDPGGDTAYSLDKGAIVAICLRNRGGGATLHDLDVLTFVTYHELAHIAVEARDLGGVGLLLGGPRAIGVDAEVVDLVITVGQGDRVEEEERLFLLGADPLEDIGLDDVLRVDRADAVAGVAGEVELHAIAVKEFREIRMRVALAVVADLVIEALFQRAAGGVEHPHAPLAGDGGGVAC